MGKPIMTQRRGKGSPSFRAPSHHFYAVSKYRNLNVKDADMLRGQIVEFVDDPSRSTLLARISFDDDTTAIVPAAEGTMVGDPVQVGIKASLDIGSVLPLSAIPEGYPIFNIEAQPGDGGSFVRASGGVAYIVSKEGYRVQVKLPSR